ncbi:MAG: hypothetical protein FWD98_01265 [Defluviitaleaceae bacterium]|nr:hypothetical protein [Defluviitaleaceae bacterium]
MYLDPGFGGMLVQGIALLVSIGGVLLITFRRKIRSLFAGGKQSSNTANTSPSGEAHSTNTLDDNDMVDTLADNKRQEGE